MTMSPLYRVRYAEAYWLAVAQLEADKLSGRTFYGEMQERHWVRLIQGAYASTAVTRGESILDIARRQQPQVFVAIYAIECLAIASMGERRVYA